jgi:hypothetical protein
MKADDLLFIVLFLAVVAGIYVTSVNKRVDNPMSCLYYSTPYGKTNILLECNESIIYLKQKYAYLGGEGSFLVLNNFSVNSSIKT